MEEEVSQIVSILATHISFPTQVAKAVTQALNRCVSCLPGQRDVDNALRAVGDASKRLLSDSVGGWGCWGNIGAEEVQASPSTLALSLTLMSQIYPFHYSVPISRRSCTKFSLASFAILASDFLSGPAAPPQHRDISRSSEPFE